MDWLAILTSPSMQLIVAGGFGGVARWLTLILLSKNLAVTQGVGTIFLGNILGYYASPSFEATVRGWFPGLSVDPDKFPVFVAFVTGVGGITVISIILDLWSNFRKQPPSGAAVEPTPPKP